MWVGVVFFVFIVLGFDEILESVGLEFSSNWGYFWPLFFKILFYVLCLFSETPVTHILDHFYLLIDLYPHYGFFSCFFSMPDSFLLDARHCAFYPLGEWVFLYSRNLFWNTVTWKKFGPLRSCRTGSIWGSLLLTTEARALCVLHEGPRRLRLSSLARRTSTASGPVCAPAAAATHPVGCFVCLRVPPSRVRADQYAGEYLSGTPCRSLKFSLSAARSSLWL